MGEEVRSKGMSEDAVDGRSSQIFWDLVSYLNELVFLLVRWVLIAQVLNGGMTRVILYKDLDAVPYTRGDCRSGKGHWRKQATIQEPTAIIQEKNNGASDQKVARE